MDVRKMEKIRRKLGFINGIEVFAIRSRGGLCSEWKEGIDVVL